MQINRLTKLAGILTAAAILLSTSCIAEGSTLWGNLEPGPYGIGYRTIEKYDSSRVFRSKTDYFGQIIPGERSRPIQVCIWYPAQTTVSDIKMVIGEYSYTYPNDENFIGHLALIENRSVGFWQRSLGIGVGAVLDLFSVRTEAVKNAKAADGRFPLLLYFPSLEGVLEENMVLCEYLASHGFIVAATHPVGQFQIASGLSQSDLETMIRDQEFVWMQAKDWPGLDPDKLGVIGFESGGSAALLMQMRNGDVDAVAGIGGALTYPAMTDLLLGSAGYDTLKASVPVMQFYSDFDREPDLKLINGLHFAPMYAYYGAAFGIEDFTVVKALRSHIPDSSGNVGVLDNHKYETVCRMVLNYFKAVLQEDDKALQYIENKPETNGFAADLYTVKFSRGRKLPPTEEQFMAIMQTSGVPVACDLFYKYYQDFSGWRFFDETAVNEYGYRMLQTGQTEQAVKLFRMNTDAYPASANGWDSYADGLLATGDSTTAAGCYRKVLEILDTDTTLDQRFRAILKGNADRFLTNSNR